MPLTEPVTDYPPVVLVEWVDTTNIATWTDLDEIADWAATGGFVCRNIGYLVHEDPHCVVLAARVALGSEPQQVGLFERIPSGCVLHMETLAPGEPVLPAATVHRMHTAARSSSSSSA